MILVSEMQDRAFCELGEARHVEVVVRVEGAALPLPVRGVSVVNGKLELKVEQGGEKR